MHDINPHGSLQIGRLPRFSIAQLNGLAAQLSIMRDGGGDEITKEVEIKLAARLAHLRDPLGWRRRRRAGIRSWSSNELSNTAAAASMPPIDGREILRQSL